MVLGISLFSLVNSAILVTAIKESGWWRNGFIMSLECYCALSPSSHLEKLMIIILKMLAECFNFIGKKHTVKAWFITQRNPKALIKIDLCWNKTLVLIRCVIFVIITYFRLNEFPTLLAVSSPCFLPTASYPGSDCHHWPSHISGAWPPQTCFNIFTPPNYLDHSIPFPTGKFIAEVWIFKY